MHASDPLDEDAILALNRAHEAQTSALDAAALRGLLAQAFHAELRGRDAVLIALDETAQYASPNFLWFRERYPRFVYVDRVIVADARRGRGLARGLYGDLFAAARASGRDLVACEVNVEPPNPASMAFHRALGFAEVGRAVLARRGRTVAYLARSV